ncbi:hypothetical protein [Endozoicomonas sp. ALB032]|uniref:hypothetical protein n=1 Tax=Endozoicomonas sp. ALB032 TaxID=3403082 RepID=UPI003BB6E112
MTDEMELMIFKFEQAIEEIELYYAEQNRLLEYITSLELELAKYKNKKKQFNTEDEFDEHYYLNKYPDVLKSKLTAKEHYLKYGKFLGRKPNSFNNR